MKSRLANFFLSKFMFWILVMLVGGYFLFSINTKKIEDLEAKGEKLTFFQKVITAVSMPRLKLGIDLKGGTYLVVGVEVEKALAEKLKIESKNLDGLFREKNLKVLPTKKEVKDSALNLYFDDEQAAKICYNFVKKEALSLKTTLKGSVVTCMLTPAEEQRIRVGSVDQAVNVLNNRLSGFGVEGITVQQHGEKQVVVQLPGVDDPERVKSVITKTAKLDFKLVEKSAASKQDLLDDYDGELPEDKMIILGRKEDARRGAGRAYLVSAYPDLTGQHIVDARIAYGKYNRMVVNFKLDASGARKFRELTSNNVGRQLGIVIDNVLFSAPNISEPIEGGSGSISGMGDADEARDLALVLRSGSLVAPLKFEQETRVGASLGQDSINKGLIACLVALALLFFFSLFYYKVAGFFAICALVFNLFLVLLFLSYFESALTLPGIAGMVLTIGMAIDASVLIYERIKEELATGMTFRKALNDGFKRAMVVILDSNITTFLTGFILFKFGGPAIKGFAVTLMVGIIATILAGVFFLKSVFEFALDNTKAKSIKL